MHASTIAVSVSGQTLLDTPLLNKGSAFTEEERRDFGLLGILPPHVSTMEEQLARAYENYQRKDTDLERYIFLGSLQDRNETLFYRLVSDHITEMMPIIYTPTVGLACQRYSHIYRRPRGLYISYPQVDRLDEMLGNAPSAPPSVIVVTDGERILGLGDLGVGGMGIPIGKLALYTVCAGINPATTLPVMLDAGTNNESLLADPLYLGWRHPRIDVADYDAFVERFVNGVMRRFPNALVQWEDFSKHNASRLLDRYRDRFCTFNDDIQGTGAVTLAGLLAAVDVTGQRLSDQRIVILGAGSSAIGIADQLTTALVDEGLSVAAARRIICLVDSEGLVHGGRTKLAESKAHYAHPILALSDWAIEDGAHITLDEVVRHVRPTVLIGTSAQPGAFSEAVVREMASAVERPIIFPLSNPTSKCEATPADLLAWTDGRAIVATGSPFAEVAVSGRNVPIGQCNNAFVFPGVGLGVIASGATRVTDAMFVAAARTLSALSPARANPAASLYPALTGIRNISRAVAFAVGTEAQHGGHAIGTSADTLRARIDAAMWEPQYCSYRRADTARDRAARMLLA